MNRSRKRQQRMARNLPPRWEKVYWGGVGVWIDNWNPVLRAAVTK